MASKADPIEHTSPARISAMSLARSATLVIGILAFAKVVGLVEKKIALDRFGISSAWDTYTAAHVVPDRLFDLLAGGALAFAFIPIFSAFLTQADSQGAWKLASNVINTIFLAVAAVAIVVFFAAPWLVAHVIAPGFVTPYVDMSEPASSFLLHSAFHPDLVTQTANLMRILLLSLLMFSISGLSMGILQTYQNFLLPSLAPILYDVGNMIGTLVLARYFGIYGVALGAVVGAILHFGIQVPGLMRVRAKWRPGINGRDPALREVIILMIPRAIALFLVTLSGLVAVNLASNLGSGYVAAYNRGYGLMQLPETLIGTAMGIVIFPTLALLSAAGDVTGKRAALSGALRFILIASIPAAVVMFLAGRPLVSILEGGAFDAESADRVFKVLQFFAIGIVTQSAVEVMARSFYADKDTITPLWISLITAVVNYGLAVWFISRELSVAGLALANSLAIGVELFALILVLRRRWNGIDEANLIKTTIKALAASAVMGAAIVLSGAVLRGLPFVSGRLGGLVAVSVQIAIGAAVYLGMALVLRMDEIRELPRLILRRRMAIAPVEVPIEAVGD